MRSLGSGVAFVRTTEPKEGVTDESHPDPPLRTPGSSRHPSPGGPHRLGSPRYLRRSPRPSQPSQNRLPSQRLNLCPHPQCTALKENPMTDAARLIFHRGIAPQLSTFALAALQEALASDD